VRWRSWVATQKLIENRDWHTIEDLAKKASELGS